ncbi:MAG: hypothetical protein DRP74_03385 [Candidatus Omnitrophota bacterium]|nr:MAG: hypothetical protein DRP74_03385 [Candidatus Omnitrophota bacterium]
MEYIYKIVDIKLLKKIVFIFLILLFLCSFFQFQIIHPPLALTIKSDKKKYSPGDKIRITFEFKNRSDKNVKFIPLPFGFIYGKSWISVYDSRDELMRSFTVGKFAVKTTLNKIAVLLEPDEVYTYDIVADVKYGKLPNLRQKGLHLDFRDSFILLSRRFAEYRLKADLSFYLDYYYQGSKKIEDKEIWKGNLISNDLLIEFVRKE